MKHERFRDIVAEMLRHEPEGLSTLQIRDRISELLRSYPANHAFGNAVRKIPGVFKLDTTMTGSMNVRRQVVWSIDYDRYAEWREGKC
jgi:hypothetical protein